MPDSDLSKQESVSRGKCIVHIDVENAKYWPICLLFYLSSQDSIVKRHFQRKDCDIMRIVLLNKTPSLHCLIDEFLRI